MFYQIKQIQLYDNKSFIVCCAIYFVEYLCILSEVAIILLIKI